MAQVKTIRIGELSRRTGCNIETIRYYERIGLLPRPDRRGTYRQYGAADVSSLTFIRRARDLGFALSEIRALLRLAGQGRAAAAHAGIRRRARARGDATPRNDSSRMCVSFRRRTGTT